MKTQNIPQITKHHFRKISDPDYTVAVCAPDEQSARERLSMEHDYTFVYSEKLPYQYTAAAMAVAAALTGEWEATPQSDEHSNCNWYLTRADGLQLYMSGPYYNHKDTWSFGVSLPRHNGAYVTPRDEKGEFTCASIHASTAKQPAQLAKDIERRLLADAERATQLVTEAIANTMAAETAQDASIRAMRAAFGQPPPENKRHTDRPDPHGYFDGGSYEVHAGGSVTFKLYSATPDKAVKLAAAFRAII